MCSSFNKIIFATLSTLSLVNGSSLVLTASPRCVKLDTITLQGQSEFVDVETPSPNSFANTGDMSIVLNFTPTDPTQLNQPHFKILGIEAQAICIVTKDQLPPQNIISAPSCFYEFDLRFCYRLVAVEEEQEIKDFVALSEGGRLRNLKEERVPLDDCYRKIGGRFMATGTGPDPAAITGGTGGFFGAFGEVITGGSISFPSPNTIQFDAKIEMCFYPNGI